MPAGTPFDSKGFGSGDTFTSAALASGSSTAAGRSAEIKGSTKQVADLAARDAIPGAALARDDPDQMRQEGMICYVADKGGGIPANYQLQGGVSNADWVELVGIGSGGAAMVSKGEITVTNNTGALLPVGSVVAIDPAGAGAAIEVVLAEADDIDLAAANALATVTQPGGIADTASGSAAVWGLVEVLYKAGPLAPLPTRGQDVMLSEVAGRATTPADADANVPSGGSIHKLGTVVNADGYDGVGADTVVCLFMPSQRREQA